MLIAFVSDSRNYAIFNSFIKTVQRRRFGRAIPQPERREVRDPAICPMMTV